MIIHYGSWYGQTPLFIAEELDLGIGIVPPKVDTYNAYLDAVNRVSARIKSIDFQWYQDVSLEKAWIQDTYEQRADLKRSTSMRKTFIRRIAKEVPDGPLTSLASAVDDGQRSTEYARELVALRDADYPDREVIIPIIISRRGLTDPAVVARLLTVPRGVDGVALSVMDVQSYPSVWTGDEWYEWLRMIRTFVNADYRVILPYSDARGLVGLGAGASDIGTGAPQTFRQLRAAQPQSSSPGSRPAVSYMSVPLLSILHGTNASTEPNWAQLESHRAAPSSLGPLRHLHTQGATFDPEWVATGRGAGEINKSRIRQHLCALADTEAAIVGSANPADTVEQLLTEAVAFGAVTSTDVFRATGGKNELQIRLDAFGKIRSDLAF